MTNKIYSFMGLARKADKLAFGYETCERLLKKAKLNWLL